MQLDDLFGKAVKSEDEKRKSVPALFELDGKNITFQYVVLGSLDHTERAFARALCTKYNGQTAGSIRVKTENNILGEEAELFLLPPAEADAFRQEVYTIVDVYRSKPPANKPNLKK